MASPVVVSDGIAEQTRHDQMQALIRALARDAARVDHEEDENRNHQHHRPRT
ncbi:hypothetical protein [Falsihalocynthiibacter arcticus]|uniref:hypothetical protein n=1 Tax=Falsihalocynthiibacter arcticus TaxID=1579316 RepID=UPI0012E84E88|nr:hypothetical protein [Falsihalocynthiibacter arcticus]